MNASQSLEKFTEAITDRNDFEQFLEMFLDDYKVNGSNWENNNLELFLNSLYHFTKDMDGYYQNVGINVDPDQPSWRVFANMLLAARVYE